MNKERIIQDLFSKFSELRYVAIYHNDDLLFKQKGEISNSSSGETDRFEELLVNPTLVTLAEQRGNIDCGGLRFLIIAYGSFFQLVRRIKNGHLSICLEKGADLNQIPVEIFDYLNERYEGLF